MRRLPSILSSLLVVTLAAAAAPAHAAGLTVVLRDPSSQAGVFQVVVVDAAGYDGQQAPLATREVAPAGAATTVTFDGLSPGRYAVMVIHDENGNGQLDTNLVGMPVEGYGFSNNPQVMRKPTFDEAAFALPGDGAHLDIVIR